MKNKITILIALSGLLTTANILPSEHNQDLNSTDSPQKIYTKMLRSLSGRKEISSEPKLNQDPTQQILHNNFLL